MLKLMYTENNYHLFLFFGFIVALLYNNHSSDSMYNLPFLNVLCEVYNPLRQHFQN